MSLKASIILMMTQTIREVHEVQIVMIMILTRKIWIRTQIVTKLPPTKNGLRCSLVTLCARLSVGSNPKLTNFGRLRTKW